MVHRNQRTSAIRELDIYRRLTNLLGSTLDFETLLNEIVRLIPASVGGDSCMLYLFDKERERLILRASKKPRPEFLGKLELKLGEGITGWVAKERKPVMIPKDAAKDPRFKFFHNLPEDKYQAFLSIPIIYNDNVIGVINVRYWKPHKFNKKEIALCMLIAQHIGGAIERFKLSDETEKKARQLDTISEISQSIISGKYLKEILHLIVTMVAELMGSNLCSILLVDEKKQELFIEATQSLSDAYLKKPPIKIGEGIAGRVVLERKPLTVYDVRVDDSYKHKDIAVKEGIVSMLCVPMIVKDKCIGVINIYTPVQHEFTDDEIKTVQVLANQAATAIENTKLVEELLVTRDALETRKLIDRAKGILMRNLMIDEDAAYRLIQKKSMDRGKPMKEIAEAIIITEELKG